MYSPTTKAHRAKSMSIRSLYFIVIALLIGILITVWNVYQLRWLHEKHNTGMPEALSSKESDKPIVWVHARNIESGYLDHVLAVFNRIGYIRGGPDSAWDVLWAHDYPFTALSTSIKNLKPHQKVNHFPGTGYLTNKVYLATSDIKYVPVAFQMPQQKEAFQAKMETNPDMMWVQKSSSHRGIKVKSANDLALDAKDTFIQEFIQNPFLIDGRKFDLGLYVVVTSVDPLRVYVVADEMLIRFCSKDYYPVDFEDVDKYVVGDDYTPMWEMPSLKKWFNDGKYPFQESLYAYFRSIGKDSSWVEAQLFESIKGVFLNKRPQLRNALNKHAHKNSFFEMTRFDFVLDEDLNVYLMEVNMSPNLSSLHFAVNKYLYEHVIFNALSVIGVARPIPTSFQYVHTENGTKVSNNFLSQMIECAGNVRHTYTICKMVEISQLWREVWGRGCRLRNAYLTLFAFDEDPAGIETSDPLIYILITGYFCGSSDAHAMMVSERDIQVKSDVCASDICKTCENQQECRLCNKCLIPDQKELLKLAYLEHKNRGTTRRVYPESMTQAEAQVYDAEKLDQDLDENDQLTRAWFRAKCIEDMSWCR